MENDPLFQAEIHFNDSALTDEDIAHVQEAITPIKAITAIWFNAAYNLSSDRTSIQVCTSDHEVTEFIIDDILKAVSGKNAFISTPKLAV